MTADLQARKALWQEAFGDSPAAVSEFFRSFPNCISYVAQDQGEIVSMVHALPQILSPDTPAAYIYAVATGKTYAEIEAEYAGKGYGVFKPAVGEAVVEMLRPIREEAERIMADKAYLESVYKAGAQRASYAAEKTLRKVYKKLGFVAK